jgi:hypothetical protein
MVPVAGQVWCPTCQKVFCPRSLGPESFSGAEQVDPDRTLNGHAD